MEYLAPLATLFLIVFTFVASADGIYFHILKYRLYARPQSQREHLLHSYNALLFPFSILLLFAFNTAGLLLWLALILIVVSFLIEAVDVGCEKKSRADLGGLTTLEYGMHMAMVGFRCFFTAFILATKPSEAWTQMSPILLEPYPFFTQTVGWIVFATGIPIAVWHFMLVKRGRELSMRTS